MKYKHIVFDIDGTLIDTEYAVINSLIKTITEITGSAPQYESLKFALGITGRNALELLKIPDIEDALKRWDRSIKECLQSLLSRGYILGIVTSKTYQEYYSEFEPLGLADYFSTIVCADDTDEHKPQAAPLVAYLAKAHVSPENALYIGDSIYDIQCANNSGVDSGLVLWSNNVSNPIRADYYFKTPNDISKIL